ARRMSLPEISIVIPVYNEATIVEAAADDLCRKLDALGWDYELLFAENGSRDGTPDLLRRLSTSRPRVRWFHEAQANYGRAFVRERLDPVARACVVERDLFASEFVVRAQRMGRDVREIPIALHEKRPPSIQLFRRVPRVLKGLFQLGWTIRVRHR